MIFIENINSFDAFVALSGLCGLTVWEVDDHDDDDDGDNVKADADEIPTHCFYAGPGFKLGLVCPEQILYARPACAVCKRFRFFGSVDT